ncbi:MAG: TIGR04282 family arsenosugar biosynthesis glycosyltransferase, partial [Chitinophagaceae bacterium]|nr:TIGR04282 family arsenosugar biosynthesis glycosyltransferase [Chitinophagaceae bacterium]
MKSALIIFVRNPVKGQVKTRIGKTKGDEFALNIYEKLLQHTRAITNHLSVDVFVFYADFINDNDLWNGPPYYKHLQYGSDLGYRMMNAFARVFDKGYLNVMIIGSDCYELSSQVIMLAFDKLQTHDTVIGPSDDGGYYLLGMHQLQQSLFINKLWSSDTVGSDTIADIKLLQLSLHTLPVLCDVDTAA